MARKSYRDMHQVKHCFERFTYFKYWLMGLRVVDIILFSHRKYLVVTEDDNYHLLEPYQNHLALTKERSLMPKRTLKFIYNSDGTRTIHHENTYYL